MNQSFDLLQKNSAGQISAEVERSCFREGNEHLYVYTLFSIPKVNLNCTYILSSVYGSRKSAFSCNVEAQDFIILISSLAIADQTHNNPHTRRDNLHHFTSSLVIAVPSVNKIPTF